jgi:hypothetical protein
MKLITRKGLAPKVAARWKDTYFKNGEWRYGEGKEDIYLRLEALGSNPTPEEVNKAIGNSSWTDVRCDECNKYVEEVVQVGEELDYESATANICKPCLILAMEEFVK